MRKMEDNMRKISLSIAISLSLYGLSAEAATLKTFRVNMDRPSGSCQNFTQILGPAEACAVTGSGGHFQGGGEFGIVTFENSTWVFRGDSCQPGVFFHITCYSNFGNH